MKKFLSLTTTLFPFLVLSAAALSLYYPHWILWLKGRFISVFLGMIMLFMGLTLTPNDLIRLKKQLSPLFLGVLLQYTVMPLSGLFLSVILPVETPIKAGLLLLSVCPGGTASNVMTYLARGDVALSVGMTTFSTLLSVVLTPFLATIFIGNKVAVNSLGLFWDTFFVVFLPVSFGYFLRRLFPEKIEKAIPFFPALATVFITLIISSVLAQNLSYLSMLATKSFLSVFLLHTMGFFFGYVLSRLLKQNPVVCRTISIEVGMQNSGLGVVLALNNLFNPLSALPPAISSITHSFLASLLAAYWQKKAH